MIRRLLLVLAVLVGAWLVACAFLFVWPKTDKPGRADAVVVLSGGGDRRLDPALALVRRGVAPLLVISSPALDPKWLKAKRLCRHPRAIARLARVHGWTRVVVVTSTFHVTRARMLIKRCYRGGLAMVGTRSPRLRLPEEWASETGKLIVQLILQRSC